MTNRIAPAVGLAFFFFLFLNFRVLPADAEELKKDEEEQRILLPEQTEAELSEGGAFFKFAGLSMFAASAGDLATTEWGLTQPGIYEGNPAASNRGARLATHILAPAVVWWTTEKMHQGGHKKMALALRIGLMVAYSYAAMHNLNTVNRP